MKELHEILTKKKSCMPILELAYSDGKLLQSTDLENWLFTKTDLEKHAYRILAGEFFKDETNINDFPSLETGGELFTFVLDHLNFAKLLKFCDFTAKENLRPAMQGVFFDGIENRLVATNGHILKTERMGLDCELQWIVPATSLKLLSRILKQAKIKKFVLEIKVYKQFIAFILPEFQFYARLIGEKFPQYQNVFPLECLEIKKYDRETLLEAVKKLKPILTKNHSVIDIDGYTFLAENKDLDISKTYKVFNESSLGGYFTNLENFALLMPCKSQNLGVDINYLSTIISQMESDVVYWTFLQNTKSMILSETPINVIPRVSKEEIQAEVDALKRISVNVKKAQIARQLR